MPTLELPAEDLGILRRILAQYAPRSQVWAFGSRVTGGGHAGSDLDLVVRYPEGACAPKLAELRSALSDSDLPILVDVHDWSGFQNRFGGRSRRSMLRFRGRIEGSGAPGQ